MKTKYIIDEYRCWDVFIQLYNDSTKRKILGFSTLYLLFIHHNNLNVQLLNNNNALQYIYEVRNEAQKWNHPRQRQEPSHRLKVPSFFSNTLFFFLRICIFEVCMRIQHLQTFVIARLDYNSFFVGWVSI
jgi:hypothetical protein